MTAAIEFAFDTVNLHLIEADVDPRNERQDSVMLGLLRPAWKNREGSVRN